MNLTTYAYDKNNRLNTETKVTGAVSEITLYQYDSNGNQIYKEVEPQKPVVAGEKGEISALALGKNSDNAGVQISRYDGFNRLVEATTGNMAATYSYNGDGLRISKTVNGVITNQIWDGDQIALETNNAGTVTNKYVRGINLIYSETGTGANRRYFLYNGHGDTVQLTDTSGTVVKTYDYDAFGNEKNPDPNDTNMFRYCGEYFDKETGTIYLRARYYDPRIGRFISEDSVWGKDSDPLSLNLYTYCWNNPIHYIDITGNSPKDVTRALAWVLIDNPASVFVTQHPILTQFLTGVPVIDIFYAAGFKRDNPTGVYHARQDALQQYGGYNSFYDVVFDYATSMQTKYFDFTYSKQSYRFWAWKGNYLNLGAGAELGIYSDSGFSIGGKEQYNSYTSSTLTMSMTLTLVGNKGEPIASYSPSDPQWWITSFNPYYQGVQAGNLKVSYTVNFSSNTEMFGEFYRQWGGKENSPWTFDKDNYTATLNF